eukprot:scaffold105973_cov77-Phaeocystis_antarctica.AAC.2
MARCELSSCAAAAPTTFYSRATRALVRLRAHRSRPGRNFAAPRHGDPRGWSAQRRGRYPRSDRSLKDVRDTTLAAGSKRLRCEHAHS